MGKDAASLMLALSREVMICTKCELHKSRKSAVPGEGSIKADILFIGEAPGEQEDLQGKPFVGAAGRLLGQLLNSIGLRREEVYITNIVKCRPPANRQPRAEEVSACSNYLERQLKLINPKIVCPMGNVALGRCIEQDIPISKAHGKTIKNAEGPLIFPLYHPAAALYTAKLRKTLEDDFKKLSKLTVCD
jgi:DNA polymerase